MSKEQASFVIDSWIREAQTVSRLVEDLETKIKNNKDLELEHNYRIKENAKSKVLEVGVKLDQLESLLLNPPSKPILNIDDLEFRWNMLSDFRLRIRSLAANLYALPPSKGSRELSVSNTIGTDKPTNSNDQDYTKAFFSENESEILKPLVSADSIQSQSEIIQSNSFTPRSILRMLLCTIGLILGAAALLFLLIIICAFI